MIETLVDSIHFLDHEIEIHQDIEVCDDPREWDNLGHMICLHPGYVLGDKHNFTPETLLEFVAREDVISLPLYLYDHSGLWMSTGRQYPFNCPWDSSHVGYIYVTFDEVREEFSIQRITKKIRLKARAILESEVEVYSDFLSGNVYGFVITKDGEHVDSCWGFFGDPYSQGGLVDTAKEAVKILPLQLKLLEDEEMLEHILEEEV